MVKKGTIGRCLLCNGIYTGFGIAKHLQSCLPKHIENRQRNNKSKSQSFFHIMVRGAHAPDYWLHLKIASNAKLGNLDRFLRDIWLECCGHMSAFSYAGQELGMGRRVGDTLYPGMELLHEYDFGDTTALLIKVLGDYEGPIKGKKPIEILARNDPPEILCDVCGKALAVEICTECQWEDSGWLCQSCAEAHECDEEMRLPVVNSPRTGVCGYTG
jgi:hypothetical protein